MGTGPVLDMGHGVSAAIPVYEGWLVTPAMQNVKLGGKDLTKALQLRLEGALSFEEAQKVKEELCYVSPDGSSESTTPSWSPATFHRSASHALEIREEQVMVPEGL